MKTIQVSDEIYEFLKSCQEELNKQDVRCTARPIYGFRVQFKTASYDPQEYEFVNEDHTNSITNTQTENWEEDLAEHILSDYDSTDKAIAGISELIDDIEFPDPTDEQDYELECKAYLVQYIKNLSWYEMDDFCENFDIKVFGYELQDKAYESSVSLFESDIQAHIDTNRHNMPEHYTYVYSNFRTPKITKLRDILKNEIKFGE